MPEITSSRAGLLTEQVALTTKILALLKRHALKSISFSIDLKALEAAIPGKDLIGSAYEIATLFLVYNLGVWLDDKGST